MNVEEIEKIIGYKFNDRQLCIQAFCHSSYANVKKLKDNEKLEFLGDTIVNYAVAEYLFFNVDKNEGELSKLKGKIVSTETFADIIKSLGLEQFLLLNTNGTESKKIYADLFEALVAAVMLDSDVESGKQFALKFLTPYVNKTINTEIIDYLTWLKEYADKRKSVLVYEEKSKTGTEHNPQFCFEAMLDGNILGRGVGQSKKQAKFFSAQNAYETIKHREEKF